MFRIYGRTDCIWCDRAKELLDKHKYPWKFCNIETSQGHLDNFKHFFPGRKTVPAILRVIGESNPQASYDYHYTPIGGYTELVEWLKPYTKD